MSRPTPWLALLLFACTRDPIATLDLGPDAAGTRCRVGPVCDLNGDGEVDFVLGLWEDDIGGENAGRVRVLSGKEFRLLFEVVGSRSGQQLGRQVWVSPEPEIGGSREWLVPSPDGAGTRLEIRSGHDGTLCSEVPLPRAGHKPFVLPTGDVDGDGHWDFYVREQDSKGTKYLHLFSGRAGVPIRRLAYVYGWEAGDLDGDGIADLCAPRPEGGELHGISARTGELLLKIAGDWKEACSAGDVDGDGKGDLFLVSRYGCLWSSRTGQTGARLHEAMLFNNFGHPVLAGDVDGDGTPEFLLSEPGHDGNPRDAVKDYGMVYLFSPRKGRLLWSPAGPWRHASLGHRGAADVDRDGIPDIVTVAWGIGDHRGQLRVDSGASLR